MLNRLRSFLDYDKLTYFKYTCLMLLPVYLLLDSLFEAILIISFGLLFSAFAWLLHRLIKLICGDVNTLPMCIVFIGGISASAANFLNRYVNDAIVVFSCASLFSLFLYAMCYREYRISKAFVGSSLKKVAFVSFFLIFCGFFTELFSKGTVFCGFIKDGIFISESLLVNDLTSFSGLLVVFSVLFYFFETIMPVKMTIFDFEKKGIVRLFIGVSLVSILTVLINNTIIIKLLGLVKLSYLSTFTTYAVTGVFVLVLQKLISRYYANMIGLISLATVLYIQFISATSVIMNGLFILLFVFSIALLMKAVYLKNTKYKTSAYLLSAGIWSLIINTIVSYIFK